MTNTVLGPENCPWAADSLIVPALISIIFSLAGQWLARLVGPNDALCAVSERSAL